MTELTESCSQKLMHKDAARSLLWGLWGSRNHTLNCHHECPLHKFEPYELRIVLSSYGARLIYFNFRYPGIRHRFPRSQCTARGFRKQHFIEWCCRRTGSTALCAEPARGVTLPHHVPQQQHCLGLGCSMAAPPARSNTMLVSAV